jgi:hypothetical protein
MEVVIARSSATKQSSLSTQRESDGFAGTSSGAHPYEPAAHNGQEIPLSVFSLLNGF